MPSNLWRAVVTDMEYTPIGELQNADERTLNMALNRVDTASIKIRTDNPLADIIQSLDCYLKLYRGSTLMFFGLFQNSEESVGADGGHITASAAGPGWVLPKRYPVRQANAFPMTGARSRIAQLLIDSINTQNLQVGPGVNPVLFEKMGGETSIGWDVGEVFTAGGTITYSVPAFKPMNEILSELSNAADGFDWRIRPWENWVGGMLWHPSDQGFKTGKLEVGAPMGTERQEAIFEFGGGRHNVTSYTRIRSRDTQATGVRHLLNGQPEDVPAESAIAGPTPEEDEPYYAAGVIEDIVQADLTDWTMRLDLCQEHVATRFKPRDIVQWTPIADYGDGRLPRFGIDYDLGDFVTGRAKHNGSVRFNGTFRVWGVDFSVDKAGIETPKVILEYQGD